MHFEWDEHKNVINIRKHGIDFMDAADIFNHPILALRDERDAYDEERWVAIGRINIHIAVVVYAERVDDVIRLISARKATKQERHRYEKALKH